MPPTFYTPEQKANLPTADHAFPLRDSPSDTVENLLKDVADLQVMAACDVPQRCLEDWAGNAGARVPLIRPKTPAAAAEALKRLSSAGLRVVVQGGMTGLVGGGAPMECEVIVSLELLDRIEECDPLNCTITVQAGVPLQKVQETAEQHGLFFPVDLGSRGSCQIGGNIATNAGGNRVLQYGMTRSSVLGLEVVLPDGSVLSRMASVLKDNAGYDLKHLFIGSEGTLGVITRAVLRLQPLPLSRHTAVLGVSSLSQVFRAMQACRRHFGPMLTSFEVMWRDYVDFVTGELGIGKDPFAGECMFLILIELSGFDPDAQRNEARVFESLAAVAEEVSSEHIVIASTLAQAAEFWRLRESSGEAARGLGEFISFDVSIPSSRLEASLAAIYAGIQQAGPGTKTLSYGHLGDGNVHLLLKCHEAALAEKINGLVYRVVLEAGGSMSAEHGIGIEKRDYFEALSSPVEVNAMRRIKKAFDPQNLLNRGRIFTQSQELVA